MSDVKKQILELRKQGYGYKRIASELNVAISTIRYICLNGNKEEGKKGTCLNCGKAITSIPHKKEKKFCSDRCRWDYWNTKKSEERKHHEKR